MKAVTVCQLADILGATCHEVTPDLQCNGASNDSRQIKDGDLYVAIRGERLDGHDFVKQASAVSALVERYQAGAGPQLVVDDTVAALGRWAQWARQRSGARVIGITGSVGKTTTREMVFHVLSQHYRCWQSPKNYNNHIGLPLTLINAPAESDIIVAELGTNAPGEIEALTRIAQPDIAVVTQAAPAHLEGLGSLAGVVQEKLSIRRGLSENGQLIVNADCPALYQACRQQDIKAQFYGARPEADVQATDITMDAEQSRFSLLGQTVTLPLAGPGNIENALAAWTVGLACDLAPSVMRKALANLPPIAMRSERLHIGPLTVINDCYNANPGSMVNALRSLALSPGRRVFVCGHMGELGPEEKRLHRDLGPAIIEAGVQLLITVGPLAAQVGEAAQTSVPADLQIHTCANVNKACQVLRNQVKEDDTVLIKGSRSARLEIVVESLKEWFKTNTAP